MNPRTAELLTDLHELPAHSVHTSLRNPRGRSDRDFRGPLLLDYARAKGIVNNDTSAGDHYLSVTAEDGFAVTVALAEIAMPYSDKPVLLAYEQDGEPVQAGVRLVVPGDDLGGRFILGVTGIALHESPIAAPVADDGIELKGRIDRLGRLTLADLARFETIEAATETTGAHGSSEVVRAHYRGVRLWDVLEDAGPILDETVREDILSKVVIARSADGHTAVIAGGEIEPRFMNGGALIATHRDGAPLPDDEGPLRLVVPYDRAPGRFVARLASIELADGRKPVTNVGTQL
jgi:DMSO/TMAO reductase YedYZ molybdopterin-dependent catalytic subunit